jgi:tryptophan synthase beta chain
MVVRDFQSVIGRECRRQILRAEGRLPDYLAACVGGGSNSIGLFHPFCKDKVKFIGIEAGGLGLRGRRHAASLLRGQKGILHGTKSYVLQNNDGQIIETHSVSAGLDYPGVGPEHAYYKDTGRAEYAAVCDKEALLGFKMLSEIEGIVPALEPAHAVAYVLKLAPRLSKKDIIVVCLSGRGDKDIDIVRKHLRLD